MKILILSTKLPFPPKDGGAIATMNLALGLASSGCEVSMLTFNTKKHYFPVDDVPPSITEKIKITTVDVDTSLRLFNLLWNLIFSRRPYIAERFYSKEFSEKLEQVLKQQEFDVIQMEGPYLSHYYTQIRRLSKARIALRAHNIEHEIWKKKAISERSMGTRIYLSSLARRIRRLEMDLFSKVDLLVPISERDHQIILDNIPGIRGITTPTGLDINDYQTARKELENSLFFLGSLDWLPNQEGLIWFKKNVLPHLEKESEVPLLHFAGRNAPEELLNELKHPALVYHGEVEEAKAFIEKYSIMVVPLLTGSGIRIKILEGLAMGKCVVTTTKGAEGLPVDNEKNILIANDGKTFARQIMKLLSDADFRENMAASGRKFIRENFDNLVIAEKLIDFYKHTS